MSSPSIASTSSGAGSSRLTSRAWRPTCSAVPPRRSKGFDRSYLSKNTEAGSGKIIQKVLDLNYRSWWHVAPFFNPGNHFGCDENIFSRFPPEANLLCFPREVEVNVSGFEPVQGTADNWKRAWEQTIKNK